MPKRTQLHRCELHPTEDGYRVCRGAQLLGWAYRPTKGKSSSWKVRDAHGCALPKSFPSLAGCVRYLRARSGPPAARPLAGSAPSGLVRQLG
jgi:hypothetical protein